MASRICKYRSRSVVGVGELDDAGDVHALPYASVGEALRFARHDRLAHSQALLEEDASLLAPIDSHEVWAAGVTYPISRDARVAEASDYAAGAYAAIYDAPRPELFFKATPSRVVGPGQALRLRSDSTWTVPEAELALWLDADLSLLGFGLGNDLTARDIEASNPLYLPQAKVHDACCSLGPAVLPCQRFDLADEYVLTLLILRDHEPLFSATIEVSSLRRSLRELIEYLGRSNTFPAGVVLLTGTGIVPPDDIRLAAGDEVVIAEPTLGELRNPIAAGRARGVGRPTPRPA